jgi:transcriptional regulator with XRE-family HTH domain
MERTKLGPRLRRLRVRLNYSLRQVASGTRLSPSFLSLLENERTDISLSRLVRLTEFFGVQMADLFTDSDPGLVRVNSLRRARRIRTTERNVQIRILADRPNQKVEPYIIELGPRATLLGLRHAGDEFFFVLEGKLRVRLGKRGRVIEEHVLTKSDSVYFPGDLDHSYANLLSQKTSIIGVITRQ